MNEKINDLRDQGATVITATVEPENHGMIECTTCDGSGDCPFCAPCSEPQSDCPYGCEGGVCSECHGDGEICDPEQQMSIGGRS